MLLLLLRYGRNVYASLLLFTGACFMSQEILLKDDAASGTQRRSDCRCVEHVWSLDAVANVLPVAVAEGAIPLTEETIKVKMGCLCPRCEST